jgi:hypothetical protein
LVTQADETKFEREAEKNLRSHRELPNGRDFRCFTQRERTDLTDDFKKRYDDTFPGSPGSKEWWDAKFKGKKEKKGLKAGYHSGGFLG